MLYDRGKDPAENENVAETEKYKDVVKELRSILAESNKQAQ